VCGGCEYPACDVHSKKFTFWEDGVEQSTVLCIFANGTITACRNKFIEKNYEKKSKLRFHLDWLLDFEDNDAPIEARAYLARPLTQKKRSRNTHGRQKSTIEVERTQEWTGRNFCK
jgi:hypothetical protein